MKSYKEWKESEDHFWGYHLIMDLAGCNDNITKKKQIAEFAKEMVKKIKMKAVGDPIIRYLLPGDAKAGYSMLQLIETSDLTAHFATKTRTVYCDVFSCKEYDPKVAEEVVRKYFAPEKMKTKFTIRDALKKGAI